MDGDTYSMMSYIKEGNFTCRLKGKTSLKNHLLYLKFARINYVIYHGCHILYKNQMPPFQIVVAFCNATNSCGLLAQLVRASCL